jgi:hypothetical protein
MSETAQTAGNQRAFLRLCNWWEMIQRAPESFLRRRATRDTRLGARAKASSMCSTAESFSRKA